MEYGPEPDRLLQRAEYARDARELLDLVERVRQDALAGPRRRCSEHCAACHTVIKLSDETTSCFACGDSIHLGCAENHLLSCEPEQERRPILLARRR